MEISLPDALKAFVEDQVAEGGHSTTSDYLSELIRRERDRSRIRDLLLKERSTPGDVPADDEYFRSLRKRIEDSSTV